MNEQAFNNLICIYWEQGWSTANGSDWKQTVDNYLRSNNIQSPGFKAKDISAWSSKNGYEGILSNIYGFDVKALKKSPQGQIILEFYHHLPEWYIPNGDDCCICYGYSDQTKSTVKNGYGVSRNEILLFQRDTSFWSSNNQSIVITDQGLHVVPDNDDVSQSFFLEWQAIEQVTYQETQFYFTMHGGGEANLQWGAFYKGSFPGTQVC